MNTYRSILVRTPNWIGDAVMSIPFLASLRLNAPDTQITCLCQPGLVPIYSFIAEVDRVITLDISAGSRGWRHAFVNARRIKSEQFDLGFCLPPSFGTAFVLWKGGVQRRVGHAVDGRSLLLTDRAQYKIDGRRPHRTSGYLSLLDKVWPDAKRTDSFQYKPTPESVKAADRLWQQYRLTDRRPILGIGPCASKDVTMWFGDRYHELGQRWMSENEGALLVIGGPKDNSYCQNVCRDLDPERVHNLAGVGDLGVTAEILRRCDAFVGNDTGLSHLASAVGTSSVVISGPGDPAEVAPYSKSAVTVKKPLFCSPCNRNHCWRTDHPKECLELVTVDDVWAQLNALLSHND